MQINLQLFPDLIFSLQTLPKLPHNISPQFVVLYILFICFYALFLAYFTILHNNILKLPSLTFGTKIHKKGNFIGKYSRKL